MSEHPLSGVRDQLRRKTDATLGELERRRDGEVVTVGGIVSDVKHLTTKRGDPMVFLTLDDPTGSAEVVVFNSAYQAARELCVTDRILIVKGRIDHKQQGETKVIASEVTAFEAVAERREVRFALDAREAQAGVIRELARLVREFPGESPVYLSLDTSEGPKTYALGPEFRVRPDADFLAEAQALLGAAAVSAPARARGSCGREADAFRDVPPPQAGIRAAGIRSADSCSRTDSEQDLQGELHGAAALEQRDGVMQVDLGRRGEDGCRLGVVARPLERDLSRHCSTRSTSSVGSVMLIVDIVSRFSERPASSVYSSE